MYAPRLRSVTRRILGNEFDAEDATQDAFLAAFRFRGRYLAASDPYPWLYRIATRKALSLAAERRGAAAGYDAAELLTVPSAEDDALAKADAQHVRSLVRSEVPVALHVIEGLRFRDISDRLGIPPATAATRVRRGKRRLRALLEATKPHSARSKSA
ncbi:MAG: hypothetical protein NVS2B17_18910 [Candidatus Velthaea sp.]